MPRETTDERLKRVHAEALRQFDRIQSATRDDRKECLKDRRFAFVAGAQYEGALGEQFEKKAKFEVNKIQLAIIRIFNEYRNNRITVDFVSKDGTADDELADACDGLFRADEQDSRAQEAYDTAFDEAVTGGFGAWRLFTEYEDEYDPENEYQRIRIEPIQEADQSVFFDLDAKLQDKSDAKHCFVLHSKTTEAFKEEWDETPTSMPDDITDVQYDWYAPDIVKIAEYYVIEDKGDTWITYQGAAEDEKKYWLSKLTPELIAELEATGYHEIKRKKVKRQKVHKYIMCGACILDDCDYIAGEYIPIIPIYGKRMFIDNKERYQGHVRTPRDSQRLVNMQVSKLAEISVMSPLSKPIVLAEQIAGFEKYWENDNRMNYPYLPLNPITGADGNPMPAAPLAYTKTPEIPQALMMSMQYADSNLKEILGNQEEADKMVSNISGKAVELKQMRMDMQTYIYVSNMSKGYIRTGVVYLSMAKDVYVEDHRKMKVIGTNNEPSTIELMSPSTMKDGSLGKAYDLSRAKFDVSVSVGPSSISRKESMLRTLTAMIPLSTDPETQMVLTSYAIMNLEGEGAGDVKEFFRKKLVGMGIGKPTEEDMARMQAASQRTSAQDDLMKAMAQEAEAKSVNERAKVLKTMAEVQKVDSETIKNLAGVDMESAKNAAEISKAANPQVQQITPPAQA